MTALLLVLALAALATLIAFTGLKWRQNRLYKDLRAKNMRIRSKYKPFQFLAQNNKWPGFEGRYAHIDQLLAPSSFDRLKGEILALADQRKTADKEASYIPTHKKGATIAYQTLVEKAPEVIAFYQSPELLGLVSKIVGETVIPTPLHDQNSCSILLYEKPGDHIDWHYDHNFYNGRHFTVLVPIVNEGHQEDGLSAARYSLKEEGVEKSIATPPNSLVMHEGAMVLHKASPIKEGERRILLSMTFGTDPTSSPFWGMVRRIKDIAFFGPRALWT